MIREDTDEKNENANAGIKSRKCPQQHQDLMHFEYDLLNMTKHISFKPTQNEFQNRLQNEIKKIKSSTKALISADKTRDFYGMDKIRGSYGTSQTPPRPCEPLAPKKS